jgi:starch synthase (maltosyl-transferring)
VVTKRRPRTVLANRASPVHQKTSKLREVLKAGKSGFDARRVIVEGVEPCVDGGRFPAKRSVGQSLTVEADIFTDGHDKLAAVLRYRYVPDTKWHEIPMEPEVNDRWSATFTVTALGRYEYAIEAWVDRFASWLDGLEKKVDADQIVDSELLEGAELLRQAAERATAADRRWLEEQAAILADASQPTARLQVALDPQLAEMMSRHPDRSDATATERPLSVVVDPERASFGAWYEMFPRSCAPQPGKHGTFRDCEERLPYVAGMGFDVLYLPPIHPIGGTHRKGPNNTPGAEPGDTGSPWGIGAAEGGHTAVHPDLGSLADFDRLVARAKQHGLEVALDIAYQCSPDHPWVKEHPEWFRHRPDGTIQYAENPPKKYQDIYPLDFDTPKREELWEELKNVILFWIGRGVTIFRVDNPHTKPFHFWEWMIEEVRRRHPEVIFLAEAFTRPKIMRYLAKAGFSQSYTYFTWRNTKHELTEYFTELTQTPVREYMRPNLFANTPDILHEFLQHGGRPAFQIRAVLAATLAGSYGIYGPAFELCEGRPLREGSEEYLDSEKYQLRDWDLDRSDSLRPFLTRLNEIRRAHKAFRYDRSLRFCSIDNDQLIGYSRSTPDLSEVIVVVVNLDPYHAQSGWIDLPLEDLEIEPDQPYRVHDLLSDASYPWQGPHNFIALDPQVAPAHVFAIRRRVRREQDFEYYR